MNMEGTVTEAGAITRESHFVLMFHFQWLRASHFHAFKQSVMKAQTKHWKYTQKEAVWTWLEIQCYNVLMENNAFVLFFIFVDFSAADTILPRIR